MSLCVELNLLLPYGVLNQTNGPRVGIDISTLSSTVVAHFFCVPDLPDSHT
jgi:hypothetical protein